MSQFIKSELRVSQFIKSELRVSQYSNSELRVSQYSNSELRVSQYSNSELKVSQLNSFQLKAAREHGWQCIRTAWVVMCVYVLGGGGGGSAQNPLHFTTWPTHSSFLPPRVVAFFSLPLVLFGCAHLVHTPSVGQPQSAVSSVTLVF